MKSPQAFRTISEVSSETKIPTHVLRFWESKFPKINPLKRSGNRRYYRPDDVRLIIKIKTLLYENGYTVRGVQKLLEEKNQNNLTELSNIESQNNIKEELKKILVDIDKLINKI